MQLLRSRPHWPAISWRLIPLSLAHTDALADAARDGELWRLWYTAVPKPQDMAEEIERRLGLLAAGAMLPFTVVSKPDSRIVGMTTFIEHRRP